MECIISPVGDKISSYFLRTPAEAIDNLLKYRFDGRSSSSLRDLQKSVLRARTVLSALHATTKEFQGVSDLTNVILPQEEEEEDESDDSDDE